MDRHGIVNPGLPIGKLLSRVLILIIALTLGLVKGYGQSASATLRGKVVEAGNEYMPIEFATVQVLPMGVATATGSRGEFQFNQLSPGRINVKIDFLGMETIDTTFTIASGVTEMTFRMKESTFRLTEITIVAQESKAGKATSSTISRQAMDHLQVTSLRDIMQLLPGGVVSPESGLATAKTFTIRSLGADRLNANIPTPTDAANMNSMGTAIVIDGAPLSNNANLQTLSPSISGGGGSVGGGSSPNSGLDVRSLSTDNIESIEVIRGIPSVEHGDLTSGAVIIRSKAGREPLTIRLKTDPKIYQASVSKGMSLGEGKGNLNLSGDYAYGISDATQAYAYYQRATARAMYSNRFGRQLFSNTSFDFSLGKDTREMNPDDQRTQLETGARDVGVRFNTNGTWNLNKAWLKNVKYTLSGSYRDKHSFSKELLGNAFAAYSMSNTDGAVLSNRPGQKVYDADGKELTHIPSNESGLIATYLPNEYMSKYDIYGKEVNLFANINASFSKRVGKVTNRILTGVNFKTDGNLGDGKVYDLNNPPQRNLSSENSSPRPRKYSSIPFMNQFSLYAEENLLWRVAKRELNIQAGLRYDNINTKSVFSPRTNFSFEVLPDKLWLRGGIGVTAKAPTVLYLYPEDTYFDFVHFNTLNASNVPNEEQLLLASTRVFNTENKDLKIATNHKKEIGFDVRINKMRFSVTAYDEQLKNGYRLGRTIDSYRWLEYIEYEEAVHNPGAIPTLREKEHGKHNIFVSFATPLNDARSHNRGVEFDFDFGRINAIRTSFVLNGAYMRSTDWNDGHSFSNQKNRNELERNIGIYEKGVENLERERLTTTLRATHNIPSIGFVLTATAQVSWLNKYWNEYGNDTTFVAYISRLDGKVKPFDNSMKDDPEFSYLFETRSSTRDVMESYFPVVLLNFHLTKEIGENLKASFYVNNMFNRRPLYETKRSPGSFIRLNIPMYFGFELALKLK